MARRARTRLGRRGLLVPSYTNVYLLCANWPVHCCDIVVAYCIFIQQFTLQGHKLYVKKKNSEQVDPPYTVPMGPSAAVRPCHHGDSWYARDNRKLREGAHHDHSSFKVHCSQKSTIYSPWA
ncbi:hypothetical protein OH76DRAFT_839699 [Lentinus brumalis]|uniref:Uncharacterized protein n=1 Tax=Lentinus brumalis TaxID=2498619 RepID=A0A371D1M9_9APHY|nr:hypothetical protein OH76DRAFT_839699 [Polyporus brumalis]